MKRTTADCQRESCPGCEVCMPELKYLPRLHDREKITRIAEHDLLGLMLQWSDKHGSLTTAEHLYIVNSVLSSQIGTTLKYAIRRERHGNEDKPGGLE